MHRAIMLLPLLLAGCTGQGSPPTDASSTTSPGTSTVASAIPTSTPPSIGPSPSSSVSLLVGTWRRVGSCVGFVAAMRQAGLLDLVGMSDGRWMAGGVTPSGTDPSEADYCRGARELAHSHFFRADGSFGSYDENGQTVDDGTYHLLDDGTFAIETATVRFQVDGSGQLRFLRVTMPAECTGTCRQDHAWAISAFYPGTYERAP